MRNVLLLLLLLPLSVLSQVKATPTAEGYGKNATGGRGGAIYKVTNLNDSGAGSLRDAVSSGSRIIVFDISGTIILSTTLTISQDNITIAGQTSPGEGITLGISPLQDIPAIQIDASNIIITHLRVRHSTAYVGASSGADGISIGSGSNIMIQHCSVSWCSDEAIAITEYTATPTRNVTIQDCVIGEGFTGASKGSLITGDLDFISFYRNFFTMNEIRSPQIAADWGYPDVDRYSEVVNNIIYDYKEATRIRNNQGTGRYLVNVVGNFYEQPSGVSSSRRGVPMYNDFDWEQAGNPSSDIGVYVDGNLDAFRTTLVEDEWNITQGEDGVGNVNVLGNRDFQNLTPYSTQILDDGITLVQADLLAADLLPSVGASLPYRDNVDTYLVDDYNTGNNRESSYVTHTRETLAAGTASTDTDSDGIPDSYETTLGTNPSVADDDGDIDSDGYTNIEEYLYKDFGNAAPSVNRPVISIDKVSEAILQNDPFTPPVVTASDVEDGDLTSSIVVGGDTLDNTTVGVHTATYNVTDSDTNAAFEVTFELTVNTPTVALQSVSFPSSDAAIRVGQSGDYTVTFFPSNADDQTGGVVSSNTGVATASLNGAIVTVTAVATGTCDITYTANDTTNGTLTDVLSVEVTEEIVVGTKIIKKRFIKIMD